MCSSATVFVNNGVCWFGHFGTYTLRHALTCRHCNMQVCAGRMDLLGQLDNQDVNALGDILPLE